MKAQLISSAQRVTDYDIANVQDKILKLHTQISNLDANQISNISKKHADEAVVKNAFVANTFEILTKYPKIKHSNDKFKENLIKHIDKLEEDCVKNTLKSVLVLAATYRRIDGFNEKLFVLEILDLIETTLDNSKSVDNNMQLDLDDNTQFDLVAREILENPQESKAGSSDDKVMLTEPIATRKTDSLEDSFTNISAHQTAKIAAASRQLVSSAIWGK